MIFALIMLTLDKAQAEIFKARNRQGKRYITSRFNNLGQNRSPCDD